MFTGINTVFHDVLTLQEIHTLNTYKTRMKRKKSQPRTRAKFSLTHIKFIFYVNSILNAKSRVIKWENTKADKYSKDITTGHTIRFPWCRKFSEKKNLSVAIFKSQLLKWLPLS